ncbi:PREDICTED: chaperone protein dnaJ 8, chloroplastic [Tarenaya hassleriana]|uniref:chaperone protein dnaJ 8, chloroplastic n=1 Tax=Tarenaya hassleriana TaxID=28532 RepID=UPI00053C7B35|nr:PREDICTED: chaperone protein dnaJ 8, chloroplastic [Tarenaya hassleriana]
MTTALTIGANGFSGFPGSSSSSASSSSFRFRSRRKNTKMLNRTRVSCSYSSSSSSSVMDPYHTLKIRPDASEYEVKKAFRQLALKYHPDVCRGSNCGVQFQTINEAYDIVMRQIRGQMEEAEEFEAFDGGADEGFTGMNDPDYDMWEEWMGWEGAGIRDYSSHVNPYL